ncbi:MAG: hypothetical protein WC915_06565 [archaeon]|jgi:hypothetical protein
MGFDKGNNLRKGKEPWNKGKNKSNSDWAKRNSERMKLNNPMKNRDSISKRVNTIKEMYKNGEIKSWNQGLTKENNNVLKTLSENRKGFKFSEDCKKKMSKTRLNLIKENKVKIFGKGIEIPKSYMLGKHHSKKTKDIIKNKALNRDMRTFLGKSHTQESKNIISLKAKDRLKDKTKNPMWKGGISFEPYPLTFDKEFKKLIRERDNFTCLKCNTFEADAKKLYGKNLTTHHIDYIKENTFKENCCAVCVRCNAEVNSNRHHWTKFFQSLLAEKYGYKYSENGEIILEVNNEIK